MFCSGRTPLGDSGELLWGPPRVRTDPPRAIDDALGRLIVAAVTTTFERARTSRQLVARPDDLITKLGAATQRCTRYGWGFTLVLIRLDDADERNPARVEAHLRSGDTLIVLGPRDLAILMPAAPGDEVPTILARVGRSGTVSTFCYGLAACPGDAAGRGRAARARPPRVCATRRRRESHPRSTHSSRQRFRVGAGVQRADAPPLGPCSPRGNARAPQSSRRRAPQPEREPAAGRRSGARASYTERRDDDDSTWWRARGAGPRRERDHQQADRRRGARRPRPSATATSRWPRRSIASPTRSNASPPSSTRTTSSAPSTSTPSNSCCARWSSAPCRRPRPRSVVLGGVVDPGELDEFDEGITIIPDGYPARGRRRG